MTPRAALLLKDDSHREYNLGEPPRHFRSRTWSAGFENVLRWREATHVLMGFSADRLDVLRAEDYRQGLVYPLPVSSVTAMNPQAGVLHSLSAADHLRFSFARKTRLPTLKDRYSYRLGRSIPNPDLKPEHAHHWEAGYMRTLGTRTAVEVTAFRSAISGLMQEFYVEPQIFQFRNLGRVVHSGVEIMARGDPWPRLGFQLGYTYLNRRNVSQPSVPLIQTPRHNATALFTARLRHGVLLVGEGRAEAGRWDLSEAGRYLRLKGVALLNVGAIVPVGRLELRAGVRNLTDRNYWLDEGYPEEGRSIYLNLRLSF